MKLVGKLIVNIVSLLVVAYIVPGLTFDSFSAVFVAAVVIGVINTLIKPILQIIALPITLITFGLFALLINILLLWGASAVVPGFHIDGFLTAVIGSIALSLVSWFLNHFTQD